MHSPIAAFWGFGAFATTTMLNGVSIVLLYFLVTFIKLEPVVAGGFSSTQWPTRSSPSPAWRCRAR